MNYCTKCQSYYQTPGTCNCFAHVAPLIQQPVYPYTYPTTNPSVAPWVPWAPWAPTITWGNWANATTVSVQHAAGDQPLQGSFTGLKQ